MCKIRFLLLVISFVVMSSVVACQQTATKQIATSTQTPLPITIDSELLRHWKFSKWDELSKYAPAIGMNLVKVNEGIFEEGTYKGKSFLSYNLVAEGLPQDKFYNCWLKFVLTGKPIKAFKGLKIDSSGYAGDKEQRTMINAVDFAKGEPMEAALMTEDKTIIAYGRVIPYPNETWLGKCHVWVESISADHKIFAIWAEGFEPNEEIDYTGNSEGEVIKSKQKADGNGLFEIVILPAVIGKGTGLATYIFTGKAGALTISFRWG